MEQFRKSPPFQLVVKTGDNIPIIADWVDPLVTRERFVPTSQGGTMNACLIENVEPVNTNIVLAAVEHMHIKPADILELMTFSTSSHFKLWEKNRHTIALGTVANINRRELVIDLHDVSSYENNGEHVFLERTALHQTWAAGTRFLCVS